MSEVIRVAAIGAIAFAVMPRLRPSMARVLMSPMSPPLAAP